MKRVRCAIYTRKSSEEGLEQGFNSLHAQREACAAYVLSQASEGWSLLPDQYDDGGLSGGSLERPALQRLLADVAAGKIDIIVVYKVDRLTRSLLDFAKLVEAFDKTGASFVSVTQSFNTTTSMGRLTLNMLLSFAQFEREVTAERIRDKIAASKSKGMWMGGTPPLGYQPNGRTLAIIEDHAEIVRDIYRRYAELGNVRLVVEQLVRDGIRSPGRTSGAGRSFGGRQFTRGQIYHMLKSPIYVGDIEHRGQTHVGQHPAIIDRALWNEVQDRLKVNLRGERRSRAVNPSPLSGKLFDHDGEPLIPVHACKGKVRYRYYVSRVLQHDGASEGASGLRIPARELETCVTELVAGLFDDSAALATRLALDPSEYPTVITRCSTVAQDVRQRKEALAELAAAVRILSEKIEIDISTAQIAAVLSSSVTNFASPITLHANVRLKRTGGVIRIVREDGRSGDVSRPQASLINLVTKAHFWWKQLAQGECDITQLARTEGVTASYITRVVRLAFLSPTT
ncbi:MAG TPA: recombinase family protein, partial [Sphingomicrobium sp.]|nr:recombinase family protein [Sphingomicrobium sp.]